MLNGELHIDGGTFNNFPTYVMQRQGVSHIIGVNLLRERSVRYALEEVPAPGHLLRDKLMGRRNRLPGITALLLNASMMYSYARQQESRDQVDLYFAPDVHRYGMLALSSSAVMPGSRLRRPISLSRSRCPGAGTSSSA
jgi:NTE family protein